MNALTVLDAVRSSLHLGYPTHLIFADEVSGQYAVIEGRAWDSPAEASLCRLDTGLDTEIRLKAVTGTVVGVGIMLDQIRQQLSPNQGPARLQAAGWLLETVYLRSELVDVDQSTTITGTGRHPAFGVDTYRLIAEQL